MKLQLFRIIEFGLRPPVAAQRYWQTMKLSICGGPRLAQLKAYGV